MEQEFSSVTSSDTNLTQFLDNLGGDQPHLEVTPTVFNLSEQILSDTELSILKKGMKFVPTPLKTDTLEWKADILTLLHKIKWNFYFAKCSPGDKSKSDMISLRTHGKAAPKPTNKKQLDLCSRIERIEQTQVSKPKRNLSPALYEALERIVQKLDHELTIKEADKGSGIVIMPKTFYNRKILEMLQDATYEESDVDCSTLVKLTKAFATKHKNAFSKKEFEAITRQESYLATFCGLPKIHKSSMIQQAIADQQTELITCLVPDDLKFRPIVSCGDCPTRSLSDLLDKLLRPFVNKVKFRIKDTWDFLRKLPEDALEGDFTVTADISSLYTNITTSNGEMAIKYYSELYPGLLPDRFNKDVLIEIYKFCQEHLYFRYANKTYRQVNGTGMGRIYAPSLADLKQGYDEVALETQIRANFAPVLASKFLDNYGRYLDDVHFRWNKIWMAELTSIKHLMNSIDHKIVFEFESSLEGETNSIPFRDVRITITNTTTLTDLYSKPTDTFNYVPFNSCHPRHTLRNIPFSLARRIRGIVSDPQRLPIRMREMKERLTRKKYPIRLIEESIKRALNFTRESIINPPPGRREEEENNVYFVSTFDPTMSNSFSQIRDAVNSYNETQPNSSDKIVVRSSHRKSSSLKDFLMFKKAVPTGVYKCKEGCVLCRDYLHQGESLDLKNGKSLKTNERFDCLSRNVLYAAKCSGCEEIYLGETGDQLNTRFATHRQQGKLDAQVQAVKADQHFRVCGKNNYKVFPFKRLKKNCTIYRRVVEDHHIRKLRPALNGNNNFQPRT